MPNEHTIPFRLDGGHVLLDLGGVKALLDTGSPATFASVPEFEFLGEVHARDPHLPGGATLQEAVMGLREHTPVSPAFTFDVLIGLDLLAGLRLEFDWVAGVLTVSPNPGGGPERGRGMAAGLVWHEVEVQGRGVSAIVDTGAWVSYVVPSTVAGLELLPPFTDYNPVLRVLKPHRVQARIGFGGVDRNLTVGVAPRGLEDTLRAYGADAIVGTDVLVPMGTTTLDIPGNRPVSVPPLH